MKPIRIVLADDHNLLRAGIRALLQELPGVEVVGEAADGREALTLVASLRPNLVLMDIAMPQLNGLEAAARMAKEFPKVRVIILSMHATEEHVLQALRAGAAGYLLKDASTAELGLAVQAVARGETYLSPPVSKYLVADYVQRVGQGAGASELLTPRQREVLQLIAEGRSTKEIARTLHISLKTAGTHRTQVMKRLDVHEVAGLVRYAIRLGLVRADE
jgi:DNA-binding NarL/FixJ family response regulator